tara:strand:+ start:130 stop:306 length:177 start_codon:yes stop_codon:yes gene_type:complete
VIKNYCSKFDFTQTRSLKSKFVIAPSTAFKIASGAAKSRSLAQPYQAKLRRYKYHFIL